MLIERDTVELGKRHGQGGHFCRRSYVRKETPILTKSEATLGHSIDLRKSGQPEELCTLNERQATFFFDFQFDEASLEVSNKSTMINDLIEN